MRISANCNATLSQTVSVMILTRRKRQMGNTSVIRITLLMNMTTNTQAISQRKKNYVYRGTEVNIKLVTVHNLFYRPFRPIFLWGLLLGRTYESHGSQGRSKLSIEVPVCQLGFATCIHSSSISKSTKALHDAMLQLISLS